jgi:hypothetical protein
VEATWYDTLRASGVSEKDAETIGGAFAYRNRGMARLLAAAIPRRCVVRAAHARACSVLPFGKSQALHDGSSSASKRFLSGSVP